MVDDEGPSRISRSLSARLRRKEQVARGEDVPERVRVDRGHALPFSESRMRTGMP